MDHLPWPVSKSSGASTKAQGSISRQTLHRDVHQFGSQIDEQIVVRAPRRRCKLAPAFVTEVAATVFPAPSRQDGRPTRRRFPPLAHWRNEKMVFERKPGSDLPTVAAVRMVIAPDEERDALWEACATPWDADDALGEEQSESESLKIQGNSDEKAEKSKEGFEEVEGIPHLESVEPDEVKGIRALESHEVSQHEEVNGSRAVESVEPNDWQDVHSLVPMRPLHTAGEEVKGIPDLESVEPDEVKGIRALKSYERERLKGVRALESVEPEQNEGTRALGVSDPEEVKGSRTVESVEPNDWQGGRSLVPMRPLEKADEECAVIFNACGRGGEKFVSDHDEEESLRGQGTTENAERPAEEECEVTVNALGDGGEQSVEVHDKDACLPEQGLTGDAEECGVNCTALADGGGDADEVQTGGESQKEKVTSEAYVEAATDVEGFKPASVSTAAARGGRVRARVSARARLRVPAPARSTVLAHVRARARQEADETETRPTPRCLAAKLEEAAQTNRADSLEDVQVCPQGLTMELFPPPFAKSSCSQSPPEASPVPESKLDTSPVPQSAGLLHGPVGVLKRPHSGDAADMKQKRRRVTFDDYAIEVRIERFEGFGDQLWWDECESCGFAVDAHAPCAYCEQLRQRMHPGSSSPSCTTSSEGGRASPGGMDHGIATSSCASTASDATPVDADAEDMKLCLKLQAARAARAAVAKKRRSRGAKRLGPGSEDFFGASFGAICGNGSVKAAPQAISARKSKGSTRGIGVGQSRTPPGGVKRLPRVRACGGVKVGGA